LFSAIARLMDQGALDFGSSSHLPAATLRGEDSSGKLAAAPLVDGVGLAISSVSPSQAPPAPVLRPEELLARVDGHRALLSEIVRIFVQERPALLASMEAALRDGNAKDLEGAAHKAKGVFGNLSAPAAQQASVELELSARKGELAVATDAFLELRQQVERLEAELRTLTQDDRAA
jgi:HPt (histidine-containing phosphotransfer) domain-containing protein